MRTAILTKEWPPNTYGGAGVHVQFLVPALRKHISVDVHAFGEEYPDAVGHVTPEFLKNANPALATLGTNLDIVQAISQQVRPDRQTSLFSATFPGRLREAADLWVGDAVFVRCSTFDVGSAGNKLAEKEKMEKEEKKKEEEKKDDDGERCLHALEEHR